MKFKKKKKTFLLKKRLKNDSKLKQNLKKQRCF